MFFAIPLTLRDYPAKRSVPWVNGAIIFANVLMYALWITLDWHWTVGPETGVLSLVLYAFSHFSLWHLIGNMLVLWVFGNPVNQRLGHGFYLAVYLGTVLALGLFFRFVMPAHVLGASGAIFAVVIVALMLMPGARVLLGYIAVFPITLIIGLIKKPKYAANWFIRWGEVTLLAFWCLFLVPLMQLWSLYWSDWSLTYVGHLLGIVCGVLAVLLLPKSITMRKKSEFV